MNSINKNIQIKILNYFKIYDFTRILHDFSLKISKSILQIQEKKNHYLQHKSLCKV